VAADAPKFYMTEIANEILTTEKDKKTGRIKQFFKRLGPNHSFDCCAMQVLAACIEKIIGEAEIVSENQGNSLEKHEDES
jgi:hypothetical protein